MLKPEFNGLRIRDDKTGKIYLIDEGKKRHIATRDIYDHLFKDWNGIISSAIIDKIDEGKPINNYLMTKLMRLPNDPKVYLSDADTIRWINSSKVFDFYNFNSGQIINVEFNNIPVGPDIKESQFEWEAKVVSLIYDNDVLKGLKGSPDIFWSASVQNDTDATIRQHISKEISKSSTFEFSFTETLSTSLTVEFEAGVPLLASANVSASVSLEISANQRWEKSETLTYVVDCEVEIPQNTSLRLAANIDWLQNQGIPFEMTVRVRANDRDKKEIWLDNSRLSDYLILTGCDKKNIKLDENNPYQVFVKIKGELSGAWGINSTILVTSPPELGTRTMSLSPGSNEVPSAKKGFRMIGRPPLDGIF